MFLRFTTAGESHGKALVAIVEGIPAGMPVQIDAINRELWRRQQGYGRSARMKIEKDEVEILSGVRHGITLGSPIALLIENKDFVRWQGVMDVKNTSSTDARKVTRPRPGHADLAGGQKFGARDLRNILERASARETAARVAAGSLAKQLLLHFGIEVLSHVVQLGGIPDEPIDRTWEEIKGIPDDSPLRCADRDAQDVIIDAIERAKADGDTLGGVFEVVAHGVPAGLGSHTSWNEKLDGRIARAVMSIHAVKAVEIGTGVANAGRRGSQVHDEIRYETEDRKQGTREGFGLDPLSTVRGSQTGFTRATNRAGGLEGGITNGEELRVRGYMKPISTLRKPLRSVDIETKEPSEAAFERSDITAVPAAGVIGESMLAIAVADAMREKFGGDSLEEMTRNYRAYMQSLLSY